MYDFPILFVFTTFIIQLSKVVTFLNNCKAFYINLLNLMRLRNKSLVICACAPVNYLLLLKKVVKKRVIVILI